MAATPVTLVGLAGTNGSGKDTVGQILVDDFGFMFISVTELLRQAARRDQMPVTRESTRLISARWRRQFGLGVLVDKAYAEYQAESVRYSGLVMASFRNPGEPDRLHELGGQVIWIDADPKVRYERIIKNAHLRGRRAEDDRTFSQFLTDEKVEMVPPQGADEAHLHMAAVKKKADITIDNTFLSKAELSDVIADKLGLDRVVINGQANS